VNTGSLRPQGHRNGIGIAVGSRLGSVTHLRRGTGSPSTGIVMAPRIDQLDRTCRSRVPASNANGRDKPGFAPIGFRANPHRPGPRMIRHCRWARTGATALAVLIGQVDVPRGRASSDGWVTMRPDRKVLIVSASASAWQRTPSQGRMPWLMRIWSSGTGSLAYSVGELPSERAHQAEIKGGDG
jgi:hypothetical protein